jgi:alkylation response protein AidB-like acyl-CoA dehydrogenase
VRLLGAARALAPEIRAAADQIERDRRLPLPIVDALAEAGIFRMQVPRALGGGEVDPITQMDVLEELSCADGSVGWVASIGSGTAYCTGFLSPEAGQVIYGRDPNAIMGGIFAIPAGRALAVGGGYRVTGRWPFASGCQHCTWLVGTSVVYDGETPRLDENGEPITRVMIFPAAEATILDTWYTAGLRGTGSHDIAVTDLFVPQAFSFWWTDGPSYPGPLYTGRYFLLAHAAHALGLARRAIDTLVELAQRKTPNRTKSLLRDRPLAQMQVAQAEALVQSARLFAWETTARIWEHVSAGGGLTDRQRALARLAITHAVNAGAEAIDLVYSAGGGTSIYATSPLERCFRDVHTATQHSVANPTSYEPIGQALLNPGAGQPIGRATLALL